MSAVRTALYQRLTGYAPLTSLLPQPDAVYHQVAPRTAPVPFVVFNKQSGVPTWAMPSVAMENETWLVKAVDRDDSASDAEAVAAQIDAALTDAPLTIAGRTHLYLRRQSDVDYAEQAGAHTWHHVGGIFRLVTAP